MALDVLPISSSTFNVCVRSALTVLRISRKRQLSASFHPMYPAEIEPQSAISLRQSGLQKLHLVENLFAKIKGWRRTHTHYVSCAHAFMMKSCSPALWEIGPILQAARKNALRAMSALDIGERLSPPVSATSGGRGDGSSLQALHGETAPRCGSLLPSALRWATSKALPSCRQFEKLFSLLPPLVPLESRIVAHALPVCAGTSRQVAGHTVNL